ncbi:Uncharacterised protein [Mycobacterium tuberculosis]|uniref:Uncharacterized protein n=1 Tax=Mycobacterium tuberculosis TaxID=1773 RepID=A0A916LGF0_MYCTX|nr:Uncharacterised protein [Mycobacterium tuberculosis]
MLYGLARGLRGREGCHRSCADVVVDRANEMFTVGEAFVKVAFCQAGVAAHCADGECGSACAAEQLHAGGDEVVST